MRIFLLCIFFFISCSEKKDIKMKTYDKYLNQKIETRDSLLVLFTVKEWGKQFFRFNTWRVRPDMHDITYDDVKYFIGGTFYSPDRKKILIWVGEKKPNASDIKIYHKDEPEIDRICPTGGDTVYSMSALIGFRENPNSIWKLYPFDQKMAACSNNKEKLINSLGQYYFGYMSEHEMYVMQQGGKNKGHRILEAFGYNLQDKEFWKKCYLFRKDTVGSFDLYPFQIIGYNCDIDDYDRLLYVDPQAYKTNPNGEKRPYKNNLRECADPFDLPELDYPKEILELYELKQSKINSNY